MAEQASLVLAPVLSRKGLWLNVGGGNLAYPTFENLDIDPTQGGARFVDIRAGLPYGNESVEVLIASHILEHLHPFWDLPRILREFYRVMQPGATLRIAVPDLSILVECYNKKDFSPLGHTQKTIRNMVGMDFVDMPLSLQFSAICFGNFSLGQAYEGHYVAFDAESMRWYLTQLGFVDFAVVQAGQSRHPTLMTLYRDINAPEQLLCEVTRP